MVEKKVNKNSETDKKKNPTDGQKDKKIELQLNLSNKKIKTWLIIILAIFFVLPLFLPTTPKEITLSQAITDIKKGDVKQVNVSGDNIEMVYKNDNKAVARKESQNSFYDLVKDNNINLDNTIVDIKDESMSQLIISLLINVVPLIFLIVIGLFVFRQMRGAQDSVFAFGKNRAKIFIKGKQSVRFVDVGGVDEVKQELEEIVDFLKHPKKYQKLGAKTPKGVLLVGPAGTGKTLLARAVAGEADVPYFSMAGSEFMEMLVGVGASRVRDLFATAKKMSPSIIFIDEIDAIGRQRGTSITGGHDEREQTLNQILVEMDGFTQRDNVIVLAATNRGDLLDPALLRPGRFDRRVVLSLPDIEGRKKILSIHAKGKPFEKNIDWVRVAQRTVGFSGADLENMLNEAAIKAARESKNEISFLDIEDAATKVKLGPEKKRMQSDEEKLITAYHEAGHAVTAYYLKNIDPVHRISIVSRGHALGFTQVPPEKDKYHETRSELKDMMTMMLGGRAAEEIHFKEMTGGAASDIEQVTTVARRMVVDYGMSDLGPINLTPQHDMDKYSSAYFPPSQLSESMKTKVDEQIKLLVDQAHNQASVLLIKYHKKLDLVAMELMKKETLERDEFEKLMQA